MYDEIKKAFALVPAIKLITECDNVLALRSFRNVIDRRIQKLEAKGAEGNDQRIAGM